MVLVRGWPRPLAAQLLGAGLAGQVVDQLMLGHAQAPAHLFTPLHQRQPHRGGQRIKVQIHHRVQRRIQNIKGRRDCLPIHDTTRAHTRNLSMDADKNWAESYC